MGCQVRREGAAAEDNTQPGNAKDNKQSASHEDLKQPKPIPNDAKIGNKTEKKHTHTLRPQTRKVQRCTHSTTATKTGATPTWSLSCFIMPAWALLALTLARAASCLADRASDEAWTRTTQQQKRAIERHKNNKQQTDKQTNEQTRKVTKASHKQSNKYKPGAQTSTPGIQTNNSQHRRTDE